MRYYYSDLATAGFMDSKHGFKYDFKRYGWDKPLAEHEKKWGGSTICFLTPETVKLLEAKDGDTLDENSRILERNGIAFMWPEQESE